MPRGTKVSWHYRSAIGHGTIKGIYRRMGNRVEYAIEEHDHHKGEPSVVYHWSDSLRRVK